MLPSTAPHKKTLVTGGTGLLGTHLILALHARGIKPVAIHRSANIPEVVAHKAEWVQGDLLDVVFLEEIMQGVEDLYHAAGFISYLRKHRHQLYTLNIEATANVVNAALDAGIRKMVHVSSIGAMGRNRKDAAIDETMFWTAETSNSEYGRTKFLGELEVWRGIAEGLQAVIVNPTIIFGEHGNWHKGSMNMFRSIYNGFRWYSTGGTGFVDADDVANALIALMDSEVHTERFIVSAENKTYREVFSMIAHAFSVPVPSRGVTPFLAAAVWRLEALRSLLTGKDPLVTAETAATSLEHVTINNSKLLQALPGFTYQKLDDTIKRIAGAIKFDMAAGKLKSK